jgi:hypothetical protein
MTADRRKPRVFVLMPFGKELDDIYSLGIKAACKEVGATCERVDEQFFTRPIGERIHSQIDEADLIVADLTGLSQNVFYEVGFAHARAKTVILLSRGSEEIPFNLHDYPHIAYEGSIKRLKAELKPRLRWFLDHLGDEPAGVAPPPAAGRPDVKLLRGINDIYEEACRLGRRCSGDEIVSTTSLSLSPEAFRVSSPAWRKYIECLAQRVGKAKEEGHDMVYRVVMGFHPDEKGEPPSHKKRAIMDRRRAFRRAKALDRIEVRFIDASWVVELGIFGDSVIIGFPIITPDRELRFGLRVTDAGFARKAGRWYEQYVWGAAEPVAWTGEKKR